MLTSAQINAYASLSGRTVAEVTAMTSSQSTWTQREKDLSAALTAAILLLLDCDGKLKATPAPGTVNG